MLVFLIPARAGSKGIPNKNLQKILGRSLVFRTAREALKADSGPVIVYSDSDEILEEGRKAGVVAIKRPPEVSLDGTTTEETVQRFLRDCSKKENPYKAVAVLQCTTPFLNSEHIKKAADIYNKKQHDSVVSVTRFDRFLGYPKWNHTTDFVPVRPYRKLRQEGSLPIWMENGGIYLAKSALWNDGRRIGRYCGIVPMTWWESLEIDEPKDLEIARRIADLFYIDDTCSEELKLKDGSSIQFLEMEVSNDQESWQSIRPVLEEEGQGRKEKSSGEVSDKGWC